MSQNKKIKLNAPKTAPKDMNIFLGLFEGYPYLVSTSWNPHEKAWVYATQNCNMMHGEYTDPYFETEYEKENTLIGWLPMPEFEQ